MADSRAENILRVFLLAPFVLGVLAGFAVRYFGLVVPAASFIGVGLSMPDLEPPADSWEFAAVAAAFSVVGVAVGARVRLGYDRMRET